MSIASVSSMNTQSLALARRCCEFLLPFSERLWAGHLHPLVIRTQHSKWSQTSWITLIVSASTVSNPQPHWQANSFLDRFLLKSPIFFSNSIYPSLNIPKKGHHAVVQELLTLIDLSQFPSLALTHFIIIKLAVTIHAQVTGYTVMAFYSTAFAVLVLALSRLYHPGSRSTHSSCLLPPG